ncbi:MAG: HAMP domain-containing sensor histidine kinase [Anaerolineae bacterium]|jgi:signal transduction histidine kinase
MSTDTQPRRQLALPLLLVGSVVVVLALALALFYQLLQPPMTDLVLVASFLSATAAISIAVGYGAYRLGLIDRSPHLSWTLLGGYALSSILTFLNVWVTARLMFASQHDLQLGTVLLLFAGGIAMSLGYLLSISLTDRITELNQAAKEVSEGHLGVRVPVRGRDEMAELARAFNEMATGLEQAARQQQQLEMLRRDLVTWIGHDLRVPLTSIRVIVEALADGVVEDPATVQRYLETAQHHIRSLSQLLDDLFEVAQIDAGGMILERRPGSIRDLISDTLGGFSALAAQRGVKLEGATAPDVDPVRIDAQKIERVLSNLLDNALRHTPAGGVVRVSASGDAEGVQVEVRDSGEGISAEDLAHVFDRFYRGDEEADRGGDRVGLGLAIARGIVEAHGGHIGIDSAVGGGTRVWFTLPRQADLHGKALAAPGAGEERGRYA